MKPKGNLMTKPGSLRILSVMIFMLMLTGLPVSAGGRRESGNDGNDHSGSLIYAAFLNETELTIIEEYTHFFEEQSGINVDLEIFPEETLEEYLDSLMVKFAAGEQIDLYTVPPVMDPQGPFAESSVLLPEFFPEHLRYPHLSLSHDIHGRPRAIHPWFYFSAFIAAEDFYQFLISRDHIVPGERTIELPLLISEAKSFSTKSGKPAFSGTTVDMYAQFELAVSSELLYRDHLFFERVAFGEEPLANDDMFRAMKFFAKSASSVARRDIDFRNNELGTRRVGAREVIASGINTEFPGVNSNSIKDTQLLLIEKAGEPFLPVHRGPGIAVSVHGENMENAFRYIHELIQPEVQNKIVTAHRGILPVIETPQETILDHVENVFLSLYQNPGIWELNLWDVMTRLWRNSGTPREALIVMDKRSQQVFNTPRGGFHQEETPVAAGEKSPEKDPKKAVPDDTQGPAIEVLSPEAVSRGIEVVTKEKTLTIYGKVTDESGIFEVLVNGTGAAVSEAGEFSSELRLAYGDNELTIKAEDVLGNVTQKNYTIERAADAVEIPETNLVNETEKPFIIGDYYALVIGVEDYTDSGINDLEYAYDDAAAVYETLIENYTFVKEKSVLLENPTRRELIQALTGLRNTVSSDDNLLVYYAGHGYWDEAMEQGYWLLKDAKKDDPTDWISNSTVSDYLRAIPSKHTLLISDACFSGGIFKTRSVFNEPDESIKQIYKLPSRKAITSGALKTVPDKSVFAQYLIKALERNSKRYLDAQSLFLDFREAVINNSPLDQTPLYGVISQTGDEGGDFIFKK